MRIRFLVNIGSRDWDSTPLPVEGDEMDVSETTAQRFIARSWAVEVPPPPEAIIRGVPQPAEIAAPKPPEVMADDEPPHAEAERTLKTYVDKQRRKPKP